MNGTSVGRWAIGALLLGVCGAGAQAALQGRDLDGTPGTFEAYYDTVLNITWLADWNRNGLMNWSDAAVWASGLNVSGITGWRLPTVGPRDSIAFDDSFSCDGTTDIGYGATGAGWGTASELGHLYYVTLGNLGANSFPCTPPASLVIDPGPFSNLLPGVYWTYTQYSPTDRWTLHMGTGQQDYASVDNPHYAVAVRSGDVSAGAVPEPATVAMLLTGLGMLGWASGRRTGRCFGASRA